MRINHNIQALNAYSALNKSQSLTSKSLEKLSSGLRINRASDDAAGLAISEKMRGQIRGLNQANRNAMDGISLIQTAEGAIGEVHDMLQRMRELAVQAANGTNTDFDRQALQNEVNQLTSEINRVGNRTEFNTSKLLNGGINTTDGVKITQATAASHTLAGNLPTTAGTVGSVKIVVNNQTFDLSGAKLKDVSTPSGIDAADYAAFAQALGDITSGGVKLSDVVDIKVTGSGPNQLTFTTKSKGDNSSIQFLAAANDTTLGLVATGANNDVNDNGSPTVTPTMFKGDPTLMERVGLQANAVFASTTVATGDKFSISVGGNTAVEVAFDQAKTYSTAGDFVKDLNVALQKSGLDGQVQAAVSKDNEIQLISQTGKDLAISSVSSTLNNAGLNAVTLKSQLQQVVGPGAEGSGFSAILQIGANTGETMALVIHDVRAAALGLTGNPGEAGFSKANNVTNGSNNIEVEAAIDITTADNASKAITTIENAIAKISTERSKLGALQNRLEHTLNNLNTTSENLTSAESRIRDADMAKEMADFTKQNIINQSATAMLAQANQLPQGILSLLKG